MFKSSDYKRQIERVFGLKAGRVPSAEELLEASSRQDQTLAFMGFPSLTGVVIFLTAPGIEMWRGERKIHWPKRCCLCGRPAETSLDIEEHEGLFRGWRKRTVLRDVPHCREHAGEGQAKLAASTDAWSPNLIRIALAGMNRDFLLETVRLNQQGDVVPPWEAFPEYSAETMGWREGEGEYWSYHVWEPFWDRLSQSERGQYMDRWNAPDEWRQRLNIEK